MVAPYRSARACMSKFYLSDCDRNIILSGIEKILNREKQNELSDWSRRDIANSVLALNHFLHINISLPSHIKLIFERTKQKSFVNENLEIIVSPDIIIRYQTNDKKYIGGIKFIISKGSSLELQRGIISASTISHFLSLNKEKDVIVDNNICLCIDIMHERYFSAPNDISDFLVILNQYSKEICGYWNNIA